MRVVKQEFGIDAAEFPAGHRFARMHTRQRSALRERVHGWVRPSRIAPAARETTFIGQGDIHAGTFQARASVSCEPSMNVIDWVGSTGGAALVGVGGWMLIDAGRTRPVQPSEPATDACREGETAVLDARALYARTGTWSEVGALRIKLGWPSATFDAWVMPLLDRFAEFVQLLPDGEQAGAGEYGGLLRNALVAAHQALDRRRGRILPMGAAPEEIGARAHRWSYAVLLVALFGRARESLRVCKVTYRKADVPGEHIWLPLTGSLVAHGAQCYRVADARASSPEACDRLLPVILLQRLVPEPVMGWLAEDRMLLQELLGVLAGEADDSGSPLSALMRPDRCEPAHADVEIEGDVRDCARSIQGDGDRQAPSTSRAVEAAPSAAEVSAADIASSARCPEGQQRVGVGCAAPEAARTHVLIDISLANDDAAMLARVDAASDRTASCEAEAAVEVPDVALRFMDWLRASLADGSVRCNESRALVHGVPEGMLLVSPRVFSAFARADDDKQALLDGDGHAARIRSMQRRVLRQAWHVSAGNGINFLTYAIVRQGRAVGRISGIVIERPERFVDAVPELNPVLVRAPSTLP